MQSCMSTRARPAVCKRSNTDIITLHVHAQLLVRVNYSWTPEPLLWLEELGNALPGVRVEYVDILHREQGMSGVRMPNDLASSLICRCERLLMECGVGAYTEGVAERY
jgi:hypothetical protein